MLGQEYKDRPNYIVCIRTQGSAPLSEKALGELSNIGSIHFKNSVKKSSFTSQFQLYEGQVRDFVSTSPALAEIFSKVLDIHKRLLPDHTVKAEVAVFTHGDDQTIILPPHLLSSLAQCGYALDVTFFRTGAKV
jgi:hypothetical protein